MLQFLSRKKPEMPKTVVIEPKPTGPLADLCADIIAHPGDYLYTARASFEVEISARVDPYLSIGRGSNGSRERPSQYYNVSGKYSGKKPEQALIDEAIRCFEDFKRDLDLATIAARLAAVEQKRTEQANRSLTPAEKVRSSMIQPNERFAFDDKQANDCVHRLAFLSAVAEKMIPVLEGTHKIVPAHTDRLEYGGDGIAIRVHGDTSDFLTRKPPNDWRDHNGNPHRTRALMRSADRAIRAAAWPDMGTAVGD